MKTRPPFQTQDERKNSKKEAEIILAECCPFELALIQNLRADTESKWAKSEKAIDDRKARHSASAFETYAESYVKNLIHQKSEKSVCVRVSSRGHFNLSK